MSAPAGAAQPNQRPAPVRGMWIWQPAPVDDIVGWAAAHGVRDLFVGFPGGTADLSWYRALRTRADRARLTMSALGGDPAWALDPRRRRDGPTRPGGPTCSAACTSTSSRISCPTWGTGPGDRAAEVHGNAERAAGAAIAGGIRRAVLVCDEYRLSGGNLADAVRRRAATRLTVLTYRNTVTGPNSLLEAYGRDMLTAGRAAGAWSIRVAIETQALADCAHCTYAGARQGAVTPALADIDRLAGAHIRPTRAWPCTTTRPGGSTILSMSIPWTMTFDAAEPGRGGPGLDGGARVCALARYRPARQLGGVRIEHCDVPEDERDAAALPRRPGRSAAEHLDPQSSGGEGGQEPPASGRPSRRRSERGTPVGGALAAGRGDGAADSCKSAARSCSSRTGRPAGSLRDDRPGGQRVLRPVGA